MADEFKNPSDVDIKIPMTPIRMPGPLTRGKRRKVDFQKAPAAPSMSPLGAATKDKVQIPHVPAPPGGAQMSTKLSAFVQGACDGYEKQARALGVELAPDWREKVTKVASAQEMARAMEGVGSAADYIDGIKKKKATKGSLYFLRDKLKELLLKKEGEFIDTGTALLGFPAALGIGGRLGGRALGDIVGRTSAAQRGGYLGASKKSIAEIGKLLGAHSGKKGARIGTIAGLAAGIPAGLRAALMLREEKMKKDAADPVSAVLKRTKLPFMPGKKRARKAMAAVATGATIRNLPELLLAGLIGGGGGLALHRATELST